MPERPPDDLVAQLMEGKLPPQQTDELCLRLGDDSRLLALGRAPGTDDALLQALRGGSPAALAPDTGRSARLREALRERLSDATTLGGDSAATDVPAESATTILGSGPRRFGHFLLREVLGSGGMGVVYHAHDLQLDRPVALKVIRAELAARPDIRERFLREARHAATVEHPHVVGIHQVGEIDGVPFLAMPRLTGETLESRLRRLAGRPLPSDTVVQIGRETALGLEAAHQRGLVHRDIKPGNLWLETLPDSDGFRVRILDFGVARLAQGDPTLTETGAIVGTPAYMAPEQARGRPVDQRSDLFSLGSCLYHAATGRRPFPGADALTILTSLALDAPQPPARVNPLVPRALSDCILRLLEKDPARRFPTARSVADELALVSAGPPGGLSRRAALWGAAAAPLAAWGAWSLVSGSRRDAGSLGGGELTASASAGPVPARQVAEWVQRAGGYVEFVRENRLLRVGPDDPLPDEALPLFTVNLETVRSLTPADLARLDGLPDLTYLSLSETNVGDAEVRELKRLPALHGLYLNHSQVSDAALAHVARFQTLRELQVEESFGQVTADGLRHLGSFPDLYELVVGDARLSGACAAHLAECRALEKLRLRVATLSRDELAGLAALPLLRDLALVVEQLADTAVEGLAGATRLQALSLDAPHLTGAALPALARLSGLARLALVEVRLFPQDLQRLESFPALAQLRLVEAGLTDESVPALSRLVRLKSLDLPRNSFSEAGLAELRRALPECAIGFQ